MKFEDQSYAEFGNLSVVVTKDRIDVIKSEYSYGVQRITLTYEEFENILRLVRMKQVLP